ncbi:MAG: MaoC family dehydratase [bacterium]|nr:MaoC family dehydratase [bacterium]
MPATISLSQLPSLVGTELGVSEWFEIDQERVDAFADATLDHQYIHVDQERAKQTPFEGTIAHGFLTLSLVPHLLSDVSLEIEGTRMKLNYGSDKVRFLQPVKVGSRIRARSELTAADEKRPGQWLLNQRVTIEIEDVAKPAMVTEFLMLYFA